MAAAIRAGLPAAIARAGGGHSTAKAAVEAGVDLEEIVEVAMEDGDVMAWLLATIPEYAKEKDRVRGSSPLSNESALSRRSLAKDVCASPSPSLSRRAPRVPHTPFVCFVFVAGCSLGRNLRSSSTWPLITTSQRRL